MQRIANPFRAVRFRHPPPSKKPDFIQSGFFHLAPRPTMTLSCRPGCAACCIAPSITTPIPGMPEGKAAGVPCVQLLPDLRCALFGDPRRPTFCGGLQASVEMCGDNRESAIAWLDQLELATRPQR
jgi:uncharacterized protein